MSGGIQFLRHLILFTVSPAVKKLQIIPENGQPFVHGQAGILPGIFPALFESVVERFLEVIGEMAPYIPPGTVRRFSVGVLPKGIRKIHVHNVGDGILPALLGIGRFPRQHDHKQQRGDGKVFIAHGPQKLREMFSLNLRCRVVDGAHRTGEIFNLIAVRVHKIDFPGRNHQYIGRIDIPYNNVPLVQIPDFFQNRHTELYGVPLLPARKILYKQRLDKYTLL